MRRSTRMSRPTLSGSSRSAVLLGNDGDGSTLTLDFTTGVLDSRLTFSRASTGTFINASGLVATASNNVARFDYDPTTRTPRGLLIEASAVNYMLESTSLSGYSNGNMVAVTSGNETDPEGNANSAKQIYADATTNYHGWYRGTIAGTNTTITISIWAKARNYTFLFLSDLVNGRAAVRFNLQTGATDNNSGLGYVSASATAYQNGWWRCQMTVTVAASTSYGWAFVGVPSGATLNAFGAQYTGTGNAADGIYCYGFQVEAGSGASSYIPTGASTVQRLADNCSIVSPNFAPWYGSPTGWTVVAEMTPQSRVAGSFPGMLALRSAADSGLRIYYYNDGTYNTAFRFATASTNAEVFGPNGVTYGVPRKFGASVTSGTQFASSAGVQIGSTQTLAVPMDQTLLAIGSDGVSPTPAINCRMHFRSIKYWPYAMTLADLNARTA